MIAIAARLDTPRQVVSKWRKRFFEQRMPGLRKNLRRASSPLFPQRGRRSKAAGL